MNHRRAPQRPLSVQAVIALGFLFFILLIAALLTLPVSSRTGEWTHPLTALFTATSAVCVTGLVVVDTATHWSVFGRIVLLFAIQVGGLGVMTVLTLLALARGQKLGLRQRTLAMESIGGQTLSDALPLVRRALLVTLFTEAIGAALLALVFVPQLGLAHGAGYAVFHAISAYCNAGFDLMGSLAGPFTSLESYVGHPLVNLTICALILAGGLGFFVWDNLIERCKTGQRLSFHSKLALLLTAVLVVIPTLLFFFLEKDASMAALTPGERFLASLFSAITPRTAGFDTVATGTLSTGGSLLTMLLMLTGGNPGSTAGGAKTTTMLVILLLTGAALRREPEIHILGRRIDRDAVQRACAIVFIYLLLSLGAALLICAAQPELPLMDVLFEVLSAINTVGMSTGVTREMNAFSQIVLILLMYAGRLGSLTFMLLLVRGNHSPARYPVGEVLIG